MAERVISLTQEEVERMLASGEMKIISTPGGVEYAEDDSDQVKLEKAEKIFGEDFFGPEAIRKTFGIDLNLEFIPPVPFSEAELKRAKELNQFLILRANQASDGEPLTMKKMEEVLQPQFDAEEKGLILRNRLRSDWYSEEDFFKKDALLPKWALVSKEILPGSTNKNHLQQTQLLADYIRDEVFKDMQLPQAYEAAIRKFNNQKDEIELLLDSHSGTYNLPEAAERLAALKLNQLTRHTPVEALYDMLITTQSKDLRFLESTYTWTAVFAPPGDFVMLSGFSNLEGIIVDGWGADNPDYITGVCLSR